MTHKPRTFDAQGALFSQEKYYISFSPASYVSLTEANTIYYINSTGLLANKMDVRLLVTLNIASPHPVADPSHPTKRCPVGIFWI